MACKMLKVAQIVKNGKRGRFYIMVNAEIEQPAQPSVE